MNDPSQIGRRQEDGKLGEHAPRHMALQLCPSQPREAANKYFRARGSAQPLEKAQFRQGDSRKTKPCSWIAVGRAWLDFAGFG
jgi:hypothetical protein